MTKSEIERLDGFDWECEKEDTRYLTHNYHPYSSKYIPQIPRNLISVLSKKGDLVLDCFVGSGTTLVECKLLGRNGIGIDINPFGCLVSRVKVTAIDPVLLKHETNKLLKRIQEEISVERGSATVPTYVFGKRLKMIREYRVPYPKFIGYWFQPHVTKELTLIKKHIDAVNNRDVRDFFLVAFSSIIRGVSDAASGYGNIMKSKNPPTKRRVFEKFRSKLGSMVPRMVEFSNKAVHSARLEVMMGDARNLRSLRDGSIDLICTHPPYMASVPYAEYQKLSLWWLSYDPRKLDTELIGGQRTRKDTAERYLEDMKLSFKQMYRVLRVGHYCCVVIGNPIWRRKIWSLNEMFKEIGEKCGFKFAKEIVRGKYKMTMGKMKKEYILIFRK